MIWILSALLLLATFDSLPDPLADNPDAAQYDISRLHRSAVVAVTLRPSVSPIWSLPLNSVVADEGGHPPASRSTLLIDQVGDLSPPVRSRQPKPSSKI